ncbi:MAG: dockerin type I repeat-containing protein [Planctomycetes bacterium]|nr:dockerin type I repeat-containing protein [Planctomycetota bacterium]
MIETHIKLELPTAAAPIHMGLIVEYRDRRGGPIDAWFYGFYTSSAPINRVYCERVAHRSPASANNVRTVSGKAEAFLKIERLGDDLTFFYKEDASDEWIFLHKVSCPGETVTYVGLFGKNWGTPPAARAVFEYFKLGDPETAAPELVDVAPATALQGVPFCLQAQFSRGVPVPAWTITSSPEPTNAPSITPTGLVQWLPVAADVGKTFTFTLTATNLVASVSTLFEVTVQNELNDDFDGPELVPGLTFTTPVPGPRLDFTGDGWVAIAHDGVGTGTALNFDTWSGMNRMPRIEVHLPTCGDFFVETTMTAPETVPAAPTDFHTGIFAAFDDTSFDGFFFGSYRNFNNLKLERAGDSGFPLVIPPVAEELSLRLERRGDAYIFLYKSDFDDEWLEYSELHFPGKRIRHVGLCSKNWGANPMVSVGFDYLHVGVPLTEPPILEEPCGDALNLATVGDLFSKQLRYRSGTPKPTTVTVTPVGSFDTALGIYSVTPTEAGFQTITVTAEMEGAPPVSLSFDLQVIARGAMFEDFEVAAAEDLAEKSPPLVLYNPLGATPSPFTIVGSPGSKKLELAVKSVANGGAAYDSWTGIDNAIQLRARGEDLIEDDIAGDFTIETKLTLTEYNPQGPQNPENFQFGLSVGFGPNEMFFWGPYRSTNVWLEYSGQGNLYNVYNTAETVTLRIRRECDLYYFFLKPEGSDWRLATTLESPFLTPPSFVGLFIKTWGASAGATARAEFEYFDIVRERGVGPELVYVRVGDTNNDGKVNIGDAITVLGYLFVPGDDKPYLACKKSADVNDDGKIDIADAVKTLAYLFAGGSLTLPDGIAVKPTEYPGCAGFLPAEVNDPGTGCETPCVP